MHCGIFALRIRHVINKSGSGILGMGMRMDIRMELGKWLLLEPDSATWHRQTVSNWMPLYPATRAAFATAAKDLWPSWVPPLSTHLIRFPRAFSSGFEFLCLLRIISIIWYVLRFKCVYVQYLCFRISIIYLIFSCFTYLHSCWYNWFRKGYYPFGGYSSAFSSSFSMPSSSSSSSAFNLQLVCASFARLQAFTWNYYLLAGWVARSLPRPHAPRLFPPPD